MSKDENNIVEFDRLNTLGKAIFVAGTAFNTIGTLIDYTVNAIGDVWTLAENAFLEGSSEEIDDAVILDEKSEITSRKTSAPKR